jgi:hypothetical protein
MASLISVEPPRQHYDKTLRRQQVGRMSGASSAALPDDLAECAALFRLLAVRPYADKLAVVIPPGAKFLCISEHKLTE